MGRILFGLLSPVLIFAVDFIELVSRHYSVTGSATDIWAFVFQDVRLVFPFRNDHLNELLDGAVDLHCVTVPGVRIREHRYVNCHGYTPGVVHHLSHGGHPHVGPADEVSGGVAPRHVKRLEARYLRQLGLEGISSAS